jgi:PAS domain S-box-containing protein
MKKIDLDRYGVHFKLNLMGVLIVVSTIAIGSFAYYLMSLSKENIDNIYKNRVQPLAKYENIKDTYTINVLDTLAEYRDGNIDNKDAQEVLQLAKEIIIKDWSDLEKNYVQSNTKELFDETKDKLEAIGIIIDRTLVEVYQDNITKVLQIYHLELIPEVDEIRFNLNHLIVKELANVSKDKKLLDNRFEKILLFLIVMVIFISLITYLFSIPIKDSIEKLTKSLEDNNEKLVNTSNVLDKYVVISQADKDGIITDVSSAFCELSGYTKDELIGKSHKIISNKDTTKDIYDDMWETITGGYEWYSEIKNRKKDGSDYWVYIVISPKFDDNHNIVGYISVSKDITDKKTVQNQQQHLIEQSRHAAMGEMISMIAHQWRQPLATISAIISDSRIKLSLDMLEPKYLENSYSEMSELISYLSNTVDDFRSFFKPNKQKELISVDELVKSSIKLVSHLLDSSKVKVDIDSTHIEVNIYKNEVVQVLLNIIKNSIDELVKLDSDRKIKISYYIKASMAIIDIQDNAGGIDDSIKDKIFNPYFSTKSKNGTGLGLYMSKTIIVEHLNGKLEALNGSDGAIFRISLPL